MEGINILEIMKSLPDEKERNYEVTLTKIVEEHDNKKLKEELINILADEKQPDEKVLYATFYCLSILYRRNKDLSLLESLITRYEGRFKDSHPTFSHLYVLYLKEKGIGRDVFKIINKSYEAYNNLKSNAGIVHNFAETVAACYEESDYKTREIIIKEWLSRAEEAINSAIDLDSTYAKYYCTRGRLLAINKRYDEAKEAIRRAIDLENSSKKDYVIRLGNYQYYLLFIQNNQYSELMSEQLSKHEQLIGDKLSTHQQLISEKTKEIEEKMKESNVKNLEFLGFFAAIVSFTIGSIQIVNNQNFHDAVTLIVVLFTCLICAFSAFGVILHGLTKKTINNIVTFFIGVAILCFILIRHSL